MDIRLPYKWIKEYVDTNLDAKSFAKALSLCGPSIERWDYDRKIGDNVLNIEVTANRPDVASVVGVAREASAILGRKFLFTQPKKLPSPKQKLPLEIFVKNKKLCPRYDALVLRGVKVGPSPQWLRKRLEAAGFNSINNVVDATNYVLLEYGQPTHVFDYDKLEGKKIVVRQAKEGEKITTLDGKKCELRQSHLVIADEKDPIAVAGVKGGKKAEVEKNTKNVVIEAANFEPYSVRRTARDLNLHTEAASLFEKGLNPEAVRLAVWRVAELICKTAGGEVASAILSYSRKKFVPRTIKFDPALGERILGVKIPEKEMISVFSRLGFGVKKQKNFLAVTVPYFRNEDVVYDYDLVEEVARIYGYHRIPSIIPQGEIPRVKPAEDLLWEDRIKDMLCDIGFVETFSYSMVSLKQLEWAGIEEGECLKLANPLTSDYVYMRRELVSSLLKVALENEGLSSELRIFELSKVYLPRENDLPLEQSHLALLVNGNNREELFFELKGAFEFLLQRTGLNKKDFDYLPLNQYGAYEIGESARIVREKDDFGSIGLLSSRTKDLLGLKKETAIMEIDFSVLFKAIQKTVKSLKPIPKFPAVSRDFSLIFEEKIQWKEIEKVIQKSAKGLLVEGELFDVYRGKGVEKGKKSLAFHLIFRSNKKTLDEKTVNKIVARITGSLEKRFQAKLRG